METTRPPGFPGNPPARMPRAPTPARSPPPRPLRRGEMTFRPTHDVGPRTQCISGLNHAAYGLPVNASRPGSPQAHASLGSGWRPTLAGWDWIPTGFRTRFRRSHHGILSPLTGLSRHTRWCTCPPTQRGKLFIWNTLHYVFRWRFPCCTPQSERDCAAPRTPAADRSGSEVCRLSEQQIRRQPRTPAPDQSGGLSHRSPPTTPSPSPLGASAPQSPPRGKDLKIQDLI